MCCRQEVEELKLGCGTTEAAMQAARVQAELMASQLRAAKHALEGEKDETQALRQQVWCQMCPINHILPSLV